MIVLPLVIGGEEIEPGFRRKFARPMKFITFKFLCGVMSPLFNLAILDVTER